MTAPWNEPKQPLPQRNSSRRQWDSVCSITLVCARPGGLRASAWGDGGVLSGEVVGHARDREGDSAVLGGVDQALVDELAAGDAGGFLG